MQINSDNLLPASIKSLRGTFLQGNMHQSVGRMGTRLYVERLAQLNLRPTKNWFRQPHDPENVARDCMVFPHDRKGGGLVILIPYSGCRFDRPLRGRFPENRAPNRCLPFDRIGARHPGMTRSARARVPSCVTHSHRQTARKKLTI